MRTKQPDLCSLITRIFRVSLLSSLSAVFPVFFFLPLTKEKEEEKKKKEKSNRCAAGCICVRVLGFCILQSPFFFFHSSAQLTNFGGQKT